MPERQAQDEAAAAGARGKRTAHAIVLVVAIAFIASSAWQIICAVFGLGVQPVAQGGPEPPKLERTCAAGLHSLAGALDRAAAQAAVVPDGHGAERDASAAFHAALSPEWDGAAAVSLACASSAAGRDAWASLQRLRSAEEQAVLQSHAELEPLRRDVIAHLPSDLR